MVVTGEIAEGAAPRILDPRYRLPVIGIVAVMTVVATEAMAVTTVMPTVVRALHGLRYYSWGFTAYLLADVVGMVDAGPRTDREGATPSLVGGMVAFTAGLVVAATATDIWMFLVGRVLQGLGGGSLIVALYVVIARALPASLHPKAFALTSAAWVVPSLVGPSLAGLVASTLGWRWVFGGMAPLALAGALVLIPCLRALRPDAGPPAAGQPVARRTDAGWITGVRLAVGLGMVQEAAQLADGWSVLLVLAGAGLCRRPLLALLPAGTFRMTRGLPSVIALRGILTCAFFGAEAYLPLTLTRLHGGTPRTVGIPLTIASLGWSAGSWWRGRHSGGRVGSMQAGFALLATGVALLIVIARPWASLWLATPAWSVAGTGIGLVMPVLSVLLLEQSPEADQGSNSAALLLSDMTGTVVGIAVIAAMVNGLGLAHLSTAVSIGDVILAAVAVVGIWAGTRAVRR
ncbi:MAG TPA: MFS transporter [Mycobacteriales bacterium]|nr:MFS transporter [Mycobacteriales bacterium]